jgi:hypothetical protein
VGGVLADVIWGKKNIREQGGEMKKKGRMEEINIE